MTHAERRALIERPFPVCTFGGRSWGGASATSEDGQHRVFTRQSRTGFDEAGVAGCWPDEDRFTEDK